MVFAALMAAFMAVTNGLQVSRYYVTVTDVAVIVVAVMIGIVKNDRHSSSCCILAQRMRSGQSIRFAVRNDSITAVNMQSQ
jgi:hypothetical protein